MRGHIKAEAGGRASAGFNYVRGVRYGIEYRAQWGEFRRVKDPGYESITKKPLALQFYSGVVLSVSFIPQINVKMWGVIPWAIRPEIVLALDISSSKVPSCRYDFELSYSLRLGFLLKQLNIPFGPGKRWRFKLGSPFLPFEMSFTLLPTVSPVIQPKHLH
eukprot:scaffold140223_cov18-Tisochrysis_lutea.AAC.3